MCVCVCYLPLYGCMRLTHFYSQLEESNRTLTVDVANLASEKEELNNQLKEMQQREFQFKLISTTGNYRNDISFSSA